MRDRCENRLTVIGSQRDLPLFKNSSWDQLLQARYLDLLESSPCRFVCQFETDIQDGSPLNIWHASGTAINQSLTVTANPKVLVVILAERGARLSEPATLSWNDQTLTRDVQTAYNNGVQRSLAIYHLFNPNAGAANITGTMTGAATDTWLTSYTLDGVDTNFPPMIGNVNTGTDASGVTNLTINLKNFMAGAWAAVSSEFANLSTVTIAGTGGKGATGRNRIGCE